MEFFGGYSGGQPSLTPPRGRLGHSLPTPRVLGEGPIFVSSFNEEKQPDTVSLIVLNFIIQIHTYILYIFNITGCLAEGFFEETQRIKN